MAAVHHFSIRFCGRQVFCYQQDHRREQALGGVVEELVLSEILIIGVDESFGDNLGVLFRLSFCREIFIVGAVFIHIGVDEVQQIVAV